MIYDPNGYLAQRKAGPPTNVQGQVGLGQPCIVPRMGKMATRNHWVGKVRNTTLLQARELWPSESCRGTLLLRHLKRRLWSVYIYSTDKQTGQSALFFRCGERTSYALTAGNNPKIGVRCSYHLSKNEWFWEKQARIPRDPWVLLDKQPSNHWIIMSTMRPNWYYVNGCSSPADELSRVLTEKQLLESLCWLIRPEFLW